MWDYEDNVPKKSKGEENPQNEEENSPSEENPAQSEPKSRPECDVTPDNMDYFGLLRGRNGTDLDPREIQSGASNLTKKGNFDLYCTNMTC